MDLLVLVTGEGSQGSNQQRCSVDLLVLVTGEGSQGSNQQRCSVDLLVLVTGEGSQGSNQQRCSVGSPREPSLVKVHEETHRAPLLV